MVVDVISVARALSRLLVATALMLLVAVSAQAQTAAAMPGQQAPDIRLLIDISGSMKQNDPAYLRRPAVELLVKLLPANSRAGIWTFGQQVGVLVPHQPVSDSWRQSAGANSGQINSLGLFTHIGAALEAAAFDAANPSPDVRTSIILLTDGMVDISRDSAANQRERQRIITEVIPRLTRAGYRVHTIALSANADQALLDQIALQTDGISAVAHTADDLMRIFLKALEQSAPSEQVPLEDNSFLIDTSIKEFTALIFHKPGSAETRLINPAGVVYTRSSQVEGVSWHAEPNYDLVTLQNPSAGRWLVEAEMEPDSRVTVISNLSLQINPVPANLSPDDTPELSLSLQDQSAIITDRTFLRLLAFNATATAAEGASRQQVLTPVEPPASGILRQPLTLFSEPGSYQLEVLVDGKTFQRRFTQQVIVREPFVVTVSPLPDRSGEQYLVRISDFTVVSDPSTLQVVAKINDPAGLSAIKPLQFTPAGHWELVLAPDTAGIYAVQIHISGRDFRGGPLDMDAPPLEIQYPAAPVPAAAPAAPSPPTSVPAPETPPDVSAETPPPADDGTLPTDWWFYAGLGIGNLVILALAFFAYRMITGNGKEDSIKALEEAVAAVETDAPVPATPEPPSAAPPVIQAIELDGDFPAEDELADSLSGAARAAPAPEADMEPEAEQEPAAKHALDDFDDLNDLLQPASDSVSVADEAEDLLAEFGNFGGGKGSGKNSGDDDDKPT